MKNNIRIQVCLVLVFFINVSFIKSDYAIFELNTYQNKSNYDNEQINYFYDSFTNILYSEITLNSKDKYIMEIKTDSLGFTIYNYNCDIPPLSKVATPPLLPGFSSSKIIDHVDTNDTEIYGEYFVYILNNTINIKTNKGDKNIYVDYIFSQRNDSEYTKNIVLRPYTCFNLGFHLINKEIEDEYALNLLFQLKQKDIIDSYNWFIEYDLTDKKKAKLILGSKPYEYNSEKYKEKNEKSVQAEKRTDKMLYWDLKMNEIYLMINNQKEFINNYFTCSLEPSLGVIVGTIGYKNIVEEKLFQKINKCYKEKILQSKYVMFYCDKDVKDLLKKSEYMKLYFNHRFFGKTFELDFDDLFEEKNNFIFFKIFFDEGKTDIWRLGKPFLVKYFFSYNFDGKTISYYNMEKEENKGNKNYRTILIVVIVVLALAFLVMGFFLGKYLYNIRKKKKMKAEELINDENIEHIKINEE